LAETRERLYRTHALVLRRRDQGDADRVLTLFTPNLGKIEVIAKGVRKPTSRKAGHLEPFTHVALMIAQARTWDIVSEASTVEGFRHVRADLDAIARASYLCELVDTFGDADDDNAPLWELALWGLRTLDEMAAGQASGDRLLFLRWFELHLLNIAGFQPQFFNCLGCESPIQPVVNYLSLSDGGVFCPVCAQQRSELEALEADVLKMLRYLQKQEWRALQTLNVRQPILRRVENILHRYLVLLLERRLRSTEFLKRLSSPL
jgi:DNA repair protein RecO (recombination protein O)